MVAAAGLIVLVLLAWTLVGYLSTRGIETPEYEVIRRAPGYEVRAYAPYIRAEVRVTGTYEAALNRGFRRVAGYIFGGNKAGADVAMTSPVLSEKAGDSGQTIAMTAPVLHEGGKEEHTHIIAFVMPVEYTMATLPEPNDADVTLVQVPARRYAVVKFLGYARARRVAKKTAALEAALARDGVEATGPAIVAQYDPPWTPPCMRQNEIWIAIQEEPKDSA